MEQSEIVEDLYSDLTDSCSAQQLVEWKKAEAHAMHVRGDALKIFDLPVLSGVCFMPPFPAL
jgi:hypothetical protein